MKDTGGWSFFATFVILYSISGHGISEVIPLTFIHLMPYALIAGGVSMGSRSFNAWPQVEAFLDSIPDGRSEWRHKTLPMSITTAEREGQPVVGRAWRSKSLFINEAISHYIRKDQDGVSCSDLRLNIEALQKIITAQGEEIQGLKEASLWQRIFG